MTTRYQKEKAWKKMTGKGGELYPLAIDKRINMKPVRKIFNMGWKKDPKKFMK